MKDLTTRVEDLREVILNLTIELVSKIEFTAKEKQLHTGKFEVLAATEDTAQKVSAVDVVLETLFFLMGESSNLIKVSNTHSF